jgi:hypothetical protein
MTLFPRCWICNVVLTTANAGSVIADGSRALRERLCIPRRGPARQCRAKR